MPSRLLFLVFACALVGLAACASPQPAAAPAAPVAKAPPPVVPTAAPAPPSLRLPPLARPLRYDLELWLDPRSAPFHGKVAIDLEILQPTAIVWLNATDLGIDTATFETHDGAQTARVVPGGTDFVGFAVDRTIAPGKARLSIVYRGAIFRRGAARSTRRTKGTASRTSTRSSNRSTRGAPFRASTSRRTRSPGSSRSTSREGTSRSRTRRSRPSTTSRAVSGWRSPRASRCRATSWRSSSARST